MNKMLLTLMLFCVFLPGMATADETGWGVNESSGINQVQPEGDSLATSEAGEDETGWLDVIMDWFEMPEEE